MIQPPKGLSIGANAAGEFRLLYAGPDFNGALDTLETHPKDLHQIWLWRGGILNKTKETPTAAAVRNAHFEAAQKSSAEAVAKAQAAYTKKQADESAAKAKAAADHAAKMKAENEAAINARRRRDAELLAAAAKSAAELAGATATAGKKKIES